MDVNRTNQHWKVYRSKLLIKAKQLTHPLTFIDALGREHRGQPGDYLMEWSKGLLRIVPQEFFEDAYIPLKSTTSGTMSQPNGRPRRNTLMPLATQGQTAILAGKPHPQ